MALGLLFVAFAVLMAWMLDGTYRSIYSYRDPTPAELSRIGSLTLSARFSMPYHMPLRWLGIACMSLAFTTALFFRDGPAVAVWALVVTFGLIGTAAPNLSRWWHIKHRFKKRRK